MDGGKTARIERIPQKNVFVSITQKTRKWKIIVESTSPAKL